MWRMRRWGVPARDMTEARRAAMKARRGPLNNRWRGGRTHSNGYVLVKAWDHPRVDNRGYVREHILVWEQAHGQLVPRGWEVHHLNGIKDDNRPENLEAMPGHKHKRLIAAFQHRIKELEDQLALQGGTA